MKELILDFDATLLIPSIGIQITVAEDTAKEATMIQDIGALIDDPFLTTSKVATIAEVSELLVDPSQKLQPTRQ